MTKQGFLGVAAALATVGGLASGCSRTLPPAPAVLHYDGATTISNKIFPTALPAFKTRTGVSVVVDRNGAGRGLKRAMAGEVDLAGVSRALTADELARGPYFQIIGYDALGVFVHEGNPVRDLTRAQLEGLFTGAVKNWREVGGRDLPVEPCTEHLDSERATVNGFRTLALGARPFGRVRELEDPADCLAYVALHPGAVTPATMTYAIPGVRPIAIDGLGPIAPHIRSSRYLLTRPLLLVSAKPPAGPARQFFDFILSPDGQALVAASGFVPAR